MRSIRPTVGLAFLVLMALPPAASAQDCMIGEVRLFAGNFAPRNWALAQGQLLAISQHSALFSILGTNYGGDGRTSFGLPDLRGRVVMGQGGGPGLSSRSLGEAGGAETVALSETEMPVHSHALVATEEPASSTSPSGKVLSSKSRTRLYAQPEALDETTTSLAPESVGETGGSQPHANIQPYLVLQPIICLNGIFPSRN